MSKLESISIPTVKSLNIALQPPNRIRLEGTITSENPGKLLGGFLKAIHDAAIQDGLSILELDVTALKFVNSSSIRLFLDWASWVKNTPKGGYKLHIMTTRKFMWQKTSFVAIASLASGCVEIHPSD